MKNINEQQQSKALVLKESLDNDFNAQKTEDFANKNQDKSWYADFILLFEMITTKG